MAVDKRKKFHDKDKYYRLAKEQGLRSRAAFKLTQINRQFPCLESCQTAVLDLCAAPGGWTQIAARTCPKSVQIIAVDILPIRHIAAPNVTTLIGDITTDKTKADIRNVLKQKCPSHTTNKNGIVDLVLHDGAPNIGAEYGKDAYEQNEITLHATRTATQHLKQGGTYITKVYRSRDYASLQFVFQQLFETVTAFKPKASRAQSAEIFVICQGYKAPTKLDPKLTDPKYVFENVEGMTTGGELLAGQKGKTVFDKNWNKPVRKRGGYDTEHLDFAMRHIEPIADFVLMSLKEAIAILSKSTGLAFTCAACNDNNNNNNNNKNTSSNNNKEDDDDEKKTTCHCDFFLHHPMTTAEIKECVSDLQVLNKSDFKALLNWRTQMQQALEARKEQEAQDDDDDDGEKQDNDDDDSKQPKDDNNELDEEENIQKEIAEMKKRRARERKRQVKKEREVAAKRRKRAALGMDLNAIDIDQQNENIFSLSTLTSKDALDAVAEVNLDTVTDEQIFGTASDNEEDVIVVLGRGGNNNNNVTNEGDDEEEKTDIEKVAANINDEETLLLQRQQELDEAYERYLSTTKNGLAKAGTKMAKRAKKLQRQKVMEEADEDVEMAMVDGFDPKAYAKLLQGPKGSDSSSDDSDKDSDDDEEDNDDGFHDDPMTPEEYALAQNKAKEERQKNANPLIHKFADEPQSIKTSRWFSNPLFANIGKAAAAENNNHNNKKSITDDDDDDSYDASSESEGEEEDETEGKDKEEDDAKQVAGKQPKKKRNIGLSADEVLAMMPMTDKQKRHVKRLKQMERDRRKQERKARQMGDLDGELQIVPGEDDDDDDDDDDGYEENAKLDHLSDAQKKKVLEARDLIKAGLGKQVASEKDNNGRIEIVAQEQDDDENRGMKRPLPVMDDRQYDSEHEDYDSDDYAETLALGTMILRKSKEKAFVDASYNRYAWNDPEALPEWFVDDEKRNYRPQLPIPPALLAKIKQRQMALSVKPIKKVAEARARKSKRAKAKLAAAKKKAEAVAKSTEMSEAMKLKAISKALQGQGGDKRPGKKYVVAKKGRPAKGGKGIKIVDKRLKSDTRALKRIEKKKKHGKQNGLVGSKKRRNHS